MAAAIHGSPWRLRTIPLNWHPLPLSLSTKKAMMDSFSHYENFSYDEERGFLVEVPVPPGRGKVSRATNSVLKNHVGLDVNLKRSGKRAISQPDRPLEECYSWWLGQLVHYGLPLVLSTDEAKQAVKSAILSDELMVPRSLKKMEQRMRNAISRRVKKEVGTSAKKSTAKVRRKSIKVEQGTSESEDGIGIIRTPSSRRRSQGQVKIETNASSEGESASFIDSCGAETDSDTIEEVSEPAHTKKGTNRLMIAKLAALKTQADRSSKAKPSVREASLESLGENSSSESDYGELQDIPHDAIGTGEEQNSTETYSDSEDGDGVTVAATKTLPTSHDFDDENADGDLFSGDSEYERAVVSHSQAIDGANARYGDTDTDNSSDSSYVNDTEIPTTRQPPVRKTDESTKATHDTSKSTPRSALKSNTSKVAPTLTATHSARPKQLEIRRDRKPRPKDPERASTCETTPSRTPVKRTKQDHQHEEPVTTAKPAPTNADVHPDMTYEDIREPVIRHKIARMRSMFPKETIYLCYICLAKHNGNYDEGCEELVNATLRLTPTKSTQTTVHDAQATPSSRKRKRSSILKQAAGQSSSPGKCRDDFALSDSDERIVKQEPTPKRLKASRLEGRASLISDDMHGSQIDLTMLNDADTSEEAENYPSVKKRTRKRGSHKRSSALEKSPPKPLPAVSVEIPWVSAVKSRTAAREKKQVAFPSSSPTGMAPEGILKSSPSFRSRDSLLSQALSSAGSPLSQHRTRSSDQPAQPPRKNAEPKLPQQPPVRRAQQKVAPQHQVSRNPYTTQSGWQAMNPNSKSKMRPNGQIEEEAHPVGRRTLFPAENSRIVGLSRQDGGGLLQRGIVRNPSTSNSTSTKRKHREKGF